MLAFTALAALVAAAIFGLVPALRAARPDVMHRCCAAAAATSGSAGGGWLRNGVVVVEVALCFVLLIGSGLMFRSFLALQRDRSGLRSQEAADLPGCSADRRGRQPPKRAAFVRDLQGRLRAIPGVQSDRRPPFRFR